MRNIAVILSALMVVTAPGQEPAVKLPPVPGGLFPQAPRAWLGFQVSKPDESITAHLPALPPGIGFVIRLLGVGGPAELAGLRDFDVLWKFEDQMLVNEGQLAALLRLRKPGDEVRIHGFRGGKPLELTVKLGENPAPENVIPGEMVDDTILAGGCYGPMRVINLSERLASYSTDEGRLEVRRHGEIHLVKITGPEGEAIYEGEVPATGSLDAVPEDWRRRVSALRRGLDHALEGRLNPVRQLRPRVIPPVEKNS